MFFKRIVIGEPGASQPSADCERSAQAVGWRFQETLNFYFRFNVELATASASRCEEWERRAVIRVRLMRGCGGGGVIPGETSRYAISL